MFKKILIVGFGKSGQFLQSCLLEKKIDYVIYDDGLGEINPNLDNVDCAFLSPGIPKGPTNRHPIFAILAKKLIPIISDYDLLYYFNPNAKFIGITGTSGKTTTTMLISHLLSAGGIHNYMAGNMGVNIFNLNAKVYVLELGAAQCETLQHITFDYGIITNIANDHTDDFECYERYVSAKLKLINKNNFNPDQRFFLGPGCPAINVIPLELQNINIDLIPDNNCRLLHNLHNIQVAYSIALCFGCNEAVLKSLNSFQFAPYRQKTIANMDNIRIINDSKATNSVAIEAALNNFNNDIYLLLGGRCKNFDFSFLDKHINKIKECICFGLNGPEFYKYLQSKQVKCHLIEKLCNTKEILSKWYRNKTAKTILFSPFGQSFDEFNSYEERGRVFDEIVQQILDEK